MLLSEGRLLLRTVHLCVLIIMTVPKGLQPAKNTLPNSLRQYLDAGYPKHIMNANNVYVSTPQLQSVVRTCGNIHMLVVEVSLMTLTHTGPRSTFNSGNASLASVPPCT
jgi:hypothetical protein